jgi:ABC-type transport system involved in cytochrome c biogenesis permease subunit
MTQPSPTLLLCRRIAAALAFAGLIGVFYQLVIDNTPKGEPRKVENYRPLPEDLLRAAETLPIHDGGRVKPLSTYAGFTLFSLHGARSIEINDETGTTHKLKPTAWLLDTLFRPDLASQLPTFRVDHSAVLEAIGVEPRGRRDRYSYRDIAPAREKLIELAKSYESIDSKKRDPSQQQTLDLARNLITYETLLGHFLFSRGIILRGSGENGAPDRRAEVNAVMSTSGMIQEQIEQSEKSGTALHPHIRDLLQQVVDHANSARTGFAIFPPAEPEEETWRNAGDLMMAVMTGKSSNPESDTADIKRLEQLAKSFSSDPTLAPAGEAPAQAAGDDSAPPSAATALAALHDDLARRANDRGEYRSVPLEAEYYRRDWFLNALAFFLLGTLTALPMWALGRHKAAKALAWITLAATSAGLILCTIAIVKRSIIMLRPPVGNLYDTIIFIGTTMVLLALIVEWMSRRRFALGLAPVIGTLLIVLARRYELGDAKDHMDPLVAVLRSNYWLTTHVITITLGYSAGLLCALLSCGWLLIRGLRLDGGDRELRRIITRSVYGCLCLCLFLSLTGTVLGGIWANDSWGRFWGWDPKENGALMIVLWTLAILHARLGGHIREWGLHLSSVFTACIVAFSWWHVNFLGVGLHNYGFTAGKNTIWAFYAVMGVFLIFGFIARAVTLRHEQSTRESIAPPATRDSPPAPPATA